MATNEPYTTKVPAHAVTQGNLLDNFGYVQTTEWVTGAMTRKYVGVLINGIPFLYNQPVEIVVGASAKAR